VANLTDLNAGLQGKIGRWFALTQTNTNTCANTQ
jgi:hypothetical protein